MITYMYHICNPSATYVCVQPQMWSRITLPASALSLDSRAILTTGFVAPLVGLELFKILQWAEIILFDMGFCVCVLCLCV